MKIVSDHSDNNDGNENFSLGGERRQHRRHDLENLGVCVDRWEGKNRPGKAFGKLLDLSAGGAKICTDQSGFRVDQHIRVRIELPAYAGISPFVEKHGEGVEPKREWVGWMNVARVRPMDDGQVEVAGRLMDMDEMDRGMLGLYLSTQPLAA
jgi:hypothetical protein